MANKEILLGETPAQLEDLCQKLNFPPYTARQIASWIYSKRTPRIAAMSNLSLRNRELLSEAAEIGCQPPLQSQTSQDGTRKYLFPTPIPTKDNHDRPLFIESVYIPESDRATLCVSSQSGCRMNCAFCATGSQGFNHHL